MHAETCALLRGSLTACDLSSVLPKGHRRLGVATPPGLFVHRAVERVSTFQKGFSSLTFDFLFLLRASRLNGEQQCFPFMGFMNTTGCLRRTWGTVSHPLPGTKTPGLGDERSAEVSSVKLGSNLQDRLRSASDVCRLRKAGERNGALEPFISATFNLAVILYTNTSGAYFGESTKPS